MGDGVNSSTELLSQEPVARKALNLIVAEFLAFSTSPEVTVCSQDRHLHAEYLTLWQTSEDGMCMAKI